MVSSPFFCLGTGRATFELVRYPLSIAWLEKVGNNPRPDALTEALPMSWHIVCRLDSDSCRLTHGEANSGIGHISAAPHSQQRVEKQRGI